MSIMFTKKEAVIISGQKKSLNEDTISSITHL